MMVFHLHELPRIGKSKKAESKLPIAGGWLGMEREEGGQSVNRYEVSFGA